MLTNNKNDKLIIQLVDNDKVENYHLKKNIGKKDLTNIYFDNNIKTNNPYRETDIMERYIKGKIIGFYDKDNNRTAYPYTGNFFRCFIGGGSGSGKTTTCYNLLNLMRVNNNNKLLVIYITSIINDDDLDNYLKEIFNGLKIFKENTEEQNKNLLDIINAENNGVNLIKINQDGLMNFWNEKQEKKYNILNIDVLGNYAKSKKFNNCVVVFDDCDSFRDKKYKKLTDNFMYDILERGRKHAKDEINVNCIVIRHEIGNADNKKLFLECEIIYFNLQVLHKQRLEYICNKFNLQQYLTSILDRKNSGDTITCISTKYPYYYFTNKIINVLN